MDADKLRSILESLLFISGDPVSLNRMVEVIGDAEKKEVRAALVELKASCDCDSRGIRLVEVSGGYQFQTPSQNSPHIGRLLKTRPMRLTRPALETLAIIAYRQPVTRAEIEELRGVDSGGVLKTLLDHEFIRIMGRKDLPGKPIIYGSTPRFMEFFRLKSLSDLPTLKEMEDLQDEQLAADEDQLGLPFKNGEEQPEQDAQDNGQAETEVQEQDNEPDEQDASPEPAEQPEPIEQPVNEGQTDEGEEQGDK